MFHFPLDIGEAIMREEIKQGIVGTDHGTLALPLTRCVTWVNQCFLCLSFPLF